MTYTYKLARRLARLRSRGLPLLSAVALLAGCAAGEPTSNNGVDVIDEGGPVVLNPRSVVLEGSQSVVFRAYDSPLPGSAEVTSIEWTASGGSIGSDGSFSAAETGEFKVIGKRRRTGNPHDRPDTSVVIVVPPQPSLEALLVTPASATVGAGLQQLFTAVGRLTDGALVSVGATWSATGGTIDAGGLYTAGNAGGTYQVTATHSTSGKTATATVTIPAATLTSVKLTPSSVEIPVYTSVQFSVVGTLSDGSTATVPVVYTATGGTISYSGLYKAGSSTGTYRVIATGAGSTRADTTTVTIIPAPTAPPPPSGGLWRVEDFSRYTSTEHWRSDPYGWMITAPTWFNQHRIRLDTQNTYNGHPTLVYDWWGDDPPGSQCNKDLVIASGYNPPQVSEVWMEFAHKFAANFNSNHTKVGGNCAVSQVKFLEMWRAFDRLSLLNGTNGAEWWSAHPGTGGGDPTEGKCAGTSWNCALGYGPDQSQYRTNVPGPLWDNQWHVYRMHIRFPEVKGETTGIFEIWIDGKLVKRATGQTFIRSTGEWSNRLSYIGLGANSNSGHQYDTKQWWGHVKVWTSNPGW